MIARLRKIVLCETGGQVDYLLPLVQKGQGRAFTIATLNYDNTIELACESVQVPFTVGLDQWAEYGEFRKPEQGIELLKLHGSIDWDWVPDPRTGQEMPISSRTVQRVPLEERWGYPVLIFGAGNKLTAAGSCLDLLKAFPRRLEDCDKLFVIGYSFGDMHVNKLILRWLNRSTKRNLTIIERPQKPDESYPSLPPFILKNTEALRHQFEFLPVGASKGIADLFGSNKQA